jgi:hypothetical protein
VPGAASGTTSPIATTAAARPQNLDVLRISDPPLAGGMPAEGPGR